MTPRVKIQVRVAIGILKTVLKYHEILHYPKENDSSYRANPL